ncbi:hypothetical protein E1B28_011637 [Marasmius oreades]|uniref:Uncharacterized protein n=1 Tax=Marasmius oreades TaxID=181124 RepID=A0A9P7URE8_9AGAR|nr:uncharacterized protein E1B28_011637 [Marasmius oreades]KAG7090016.1 hypothetical protein E1B28_011637 [Marasmius oreades]
MLTKPCCSLSATFINGCSELYTAGLPNLIHFQSSGPTIGSFVGTKSVALTLPFLCPPLIISDLGFLFAAIFPQAVSSGDEGDSFPLRRSLPFEVLLQDWRRCCMGRD